MPPRLAVTEACGVEKKEIVALFLKSGVLLRHEELERLAELDDSEVREIATAPNPKNELTARTARPRFEIIKNLTSKPNSVTPALQSAFFNSRYEQMRAIASQRIARNMLSINRLPGRGEVFLTGIIRDIREGDKTVVELEDPTGSMAITFSTKPDVRLDEFAAVRAVVAGQAAFGKEILYPDIPIRQATKGKGRGCFISDLHLEEAPQSDARRLMSLVKSENTDWLFVAGDTGNISLFEEMSGSAPTFIVPGEADTSDKYPQLPVKARRPNFVSLSNPTAVRIGGIVVLLCHQFELSMLRKRHLGPSEEVMERDFLVLDFVPDVVGYGHDHKPLVSNYKATTLVNAGSLLTQATPVLVDFESRSWKQLKL